MQQKPSMIIGVIIASSLGLSACGQTPQNDSASASAPMAATAKTLEIEAPAGDYAVDLNHATLSFSLMHMGLAPYTAHFRDYSADLTLDPQDISQSSIRIEVNPASIYTSYVADYKARHEDSKFDSWPEDLARSDRFLMADKHPEVNFQSTSVSATKDGKIRIQGDLTMRGQTHPLELTATVTGSTAKHPFSKKGAIGFVAQGQFQRSTYGIDFMQGPGLLGDEITVDFQGEFHPQSN